MAPSGTPKVDEKKLAALLTAAGVGMDMESLRDLVAGVAAAPPDPRDGADWIDLVAPDAGDDLRGALIALQAAVAADQPQVAFGPAPAGRLAALRRELAACKLDGFLVPRTDEYQGEYVFHHCHNLRINIYLAFFFRLIIRYQKVPSASTPRTSKTVPGPAAPAT